MALTRHEYDDWLTVSDAELVTTQDEYLTGTKLEDVDT
jgi:hypothetical protein